MINLNDLPLFELETPRYGFICKYFNSIRLVFQEVDAVDSLVEQTKWFVQARANLQVLQESFAHAPSRDMSAELLGFLIRIMQVSFCFFLFTLSCDIRQFFVWFQVQAQEAVFLKQMIECQQEPETSRLINYIGGAAFVSYLKFHILITYTRSA